MTMTLPNHANNLYGHATIQELPTGKYEYASKEEIKNGNWRIIQGYITEVDLRYGKHLHDLHNEYPLAPENVKMGKVSKLIPNLHDKKNYVLHHRLLKFYEVMDLKSPRFIG